MVSFNATARRMTEMSKRPTFSQKMTEMSQRKKSAREFQ